MKLQDPYTGVIVDANEAASERLIARGFTKVQAAKPKPEKTEETPTPKRKRA